MTRHSEIFEVDPIPTLRRYWDDEAFRAQVDADADRRQLEINRGMDAAIERANPRKHWEDEA
ncbi:hypothetical protein [Sphingobium sp. DC-2]|uniref:hypothetical protein n=1 Tax=Sphingobium sp. DC-2 TaxID=1303256 RepID=UPI0004C32F69|nr:hypothetical protein [Sphingobium sp. DC-2]